MSSRKEKKARIRAELIKGRTVICSSCDVSTRIGLRKNKNCPICGNMLPKPIIEKLKLIDHWRIQTLREKIVFIVIASIVIVSFGLSIMIKLQLSS